MKSMILALVASALFVSGYAQVKTVVFVCEHGSAKSVIAAAYFNKMAKERKLPLEAVARGTDPDKELSTRTKSLLSADNLLDETLNPQKFVQQDVDQSNVVVLFFPLPETIQHRNNIRDWTNVKAVNEDFNKLRDDIVLKLGPLIDSLAKH